MHSSTQALLYLRASIIGTLMNFFSRFFFAEFVNFGWSVIFANYVGMILVFLMSYKKAFGVKHIKWRMIIKFIIVAHVGLLVVWVASTLSYLLSYKIINTIFNNDLYALVIDWCSSEFYATLSIRLLDGGCHGLGILCGFIVNFFGHKYFSFSQ